jgi:hypothetical protein
MRPADDSFAAVNEGLACCASSLAPEGLDRVEPCRLAGGVETEEDADQPGDADGDQGVRVPAGEIALAIDEVCIY